MDRISTGISIATVGALFSGLILFQGAPPASNTSATLAVHKPEFSASGIDPMPVGTAKQLARLKRTRAVRKA